MMFKKIVCWTALVLSVGFMVGCGGSNQTDGDDVRDVNTGAGGRPLSMFEEALVGKWSRYHGYDDSNDYFVFNADRTGCYFEYSSSSSRRDHKTYTSWALEDQGDNIFRIRVWGPEYGLDGEGYLTNHEFRYVLDEVWQGGSDNLRMGHSSTSRGCE